jgi:hypothetical protein
MAQEVAQLLGKQVDPTVGSPFTRHGRVKALNASPSPPATQLAREPCDHAKLVRSTDKRSPVRYIWE